MSRKNKLRFAASCAAALLVSQSAHATDYTWSSAVNGNWSDASNWTPNNNIPMAADTATFNAPGVNGAETIFLGPSNVAATTVTFANTGATTFNTGISGTPLNNQTLTLTNGGGITVNSGAGAVTIGSSATSNNVQVVISGTNTITNNSSNLLTFDAGADASTYSILNDTTPASDTLILAGSGKILFSGSLSKSVSTPLALQMNNTGAVELVGSGSTFAGGVTMNSGILGLRSNSALGQAGVNETLTINGGTIASVASARTIPASISLVFGGNATFGGTVAAPDGANYVAGIGFGGTVDLGGATRSITLVNVTTFTGAITDGGINKLGAGTLVLGSTGNTYAGPTIINAGTLTVASSNELSQNSALTLKNSSTLTANPAGSLSIGSLSDGGTSGGKITLGNVGGCTLNLGFDNTSTTFAGQIQGNAPTGPTNFAGIVKAGTGTQTLTGANIYNGINNRVSGGILEVTNVGNGGTSGQMTTTAASNSATLVVADLPDGSSPNIVNGMTVDDGNNVPLASTLTIVGSPVNNGTTTTYTLTLSANASTTASGAVTNIGSPSGLGLADKSAGHLTLDGGTLQYWGTMPTPASTDRLLTVTANGGGIDSSGLGPINFAGNTGTIFNGATNAIVYTGTIGATPRTITFSGTNTGANTFAPIIGDAADPVGVTKTGTGQWILTGANTYSGPTAVSGGTLVMQQSQLTTSSVAVTGGTLQLAHNITTPNENVIHTPSVSVTAGQLDLTNNKLIVTTAGAAGTPTAGLYTAGSVQGMIQAGRNGGAWNGSGIVTSESSAAGGTALTTLATATAGDIGVTTFGGQSVATTDTLVMYTYAGDMTLDGQINGDDYFRIDQGLTSGGILTGYENGDLNYDGRIDADDYFIIDKNYVSQTLGIFPSAAPLSLGAIAAVPEPASLALLAIAAGLMPRRRRRA